MMLTKKPTLSSQTRWGKLFNLMKMNKHMIPKNDANICPLYEKTKPQALIDVKQKKTHLAITPSMPFRVEAFLNGKTSNNGS